jgi:hypothetical protein
MGDVEEGGGTTLGTSNGNSKWENVLTIPVELGFERKTDFGRVRLYAGYKPTLHVGASSCDGQPCDFAPPAPIYFGASFGFDVR